MATKEGESWFFVVYYPWPVDGTIPMSIPEALIKNSGLKKEYMKLAWRSGGSYGRSWRAAVMRLI